MSTTSQGRLVISICIRLLDFHGDPSNPCKREFSQDICDLPRSTGEAIANVIRETLKKHKINIADCKGRAYDTTASMSSDKKCVQAEIMKFAPDADYQGCCLHRLKPVICHACKIISITNMMDTLPKLYSFFDNFPKRQHFLNTVLRVMSSSKKTKIKNLCKTRWVERHTTFETILELYEYIVITSSEMCQPSDERFYQYIEDWGWDRNTKANGLVNTMNDFGHIISFVCVK